MDNSAMHIVLATTNQGKISELADALKDFGLKVSWLADFPQLGEIEENGSTFEENALVKATTAARATGFVAVADDSGLAVDYLHGAPGVHSARYGNDFAAIAGETRDQRNIRKLLSVMQGVEQRNCMFVSVMAMVKPAGEVLVTRGEWQGKLLAEPAGRNGFGYDPVFFDPLLGRSAAQLTRDEKNAHSHRGKALASLLRQAPDFLGLARTAK